MDWGEPSSTPQWRQAVTDRLDMPGDGIWKDAQHLGHYQALRDQLLECCPTLAPGEASLQRGEHSFCFGDPLSDDHQTPGRVDISVGLAAALPSRLGLGQFSRHGRDVAAQQPSEQLGLSPFGTSVQRSDLGSQWLLILVRRGHRRLPQESQDPRQHIGQRHRYPFSVISREQL